MGAAAAAPLFLLNVDKRLSVVYNDSQAKLTTKKGYAMNGCATIRLYKSTKYDSQAKLATKKGYATIRLYKPTKYDSRLRRYEIGFRSSFFVFRSSYFVLRSSFCVFRSSSIVLRFSSLVLMKMSAQICAYIFTNYHEHFV